MQPTLSNEECAHGAADAPSDSFPRNCYWSAGFEGADHINGDGVELDLALQTGHAEQLRGDYRRVRACGLRAVRESVGWRLTARGSTFDFSRVEAMLREARAQNLVIAWTLWHYGFPRDVDPFAEDLPQRMAEFSDAFARQIGPQLGPSPWINPVNEISFLTWLLTDTTAIYPYRGGAQSRAFELKRNLVRAAIASTVAIRARIPDARFFHTDPVIYVATPVGDDALAGRALLETESQFEAWDLLHSGEFEPTVAVKERFHLVGANYYHSSQWEVSTRRPLRWHLRDPRRLSLVDQLRGVRARYGLPVALTETSHVGSGRANWIRALARDLIAAGEDACTGVCIYPFIDRPDWDDPRCWHRSGVWDVVPCRDRMRRTKNRVVFDALREAQALLHRSAAGSGKSASRHERSTIRSPEGFTAMKSLIVFSHLRWDFVYQRPQHVLSLLAERWRVIFVEEPVYSEGPACAETMTAAPGIEVVRFHTPVVAPGFHDDQLGAIRSLLPGVLSDLDAASDYGVWFYTPMALPLLRDLTPRVICYDCMDELSAFRNAPKQILQRESALLRIANVVFTGGPSLYRSKRNANPNVHCIPSAVDAAHFARAADPAIALPEMARLPGPRLGYYGVVDERFDISLLSAIADLKPAWQFIIVGPVVKIDPASLPQRPNIMYVGQVPYAYLPGALAAWDVALLPFARNEATRFVSPTKTLEYLAGGKPVVSTRIADVDELYGSAVRFADTPAEFVDACAALLDETDSQRADRLAASAEIVKRSSWRAAASRMQEKIEAALHDGLKSEVGVLFTDRPRQPALSIKPASMTADCLVVGAGPTGLSAAYHLGENATLLESRSDVGGWCRSVHDRGFTFDHAGHIMFSDSEVVLALYKKLLGDNILWQDREAWIYSHDTYVRYPFQGALYGLPPKVLKECLLGAIEARYGSSAAVGANPALAHDCCGDGTAAHEGCTLDKAAAAAPRNFEEFIVKTWGRGIAEHFARPYNRKLWTVPLSEMETSWLGGRVPLPNLEQMIDGALQPSPRPMGPNARFGYPLRGGFQAMMNGFLPLLRGDLHLSAEVVRLHPSRHVAELADGRTIRYDRLISTMPLPELTRVAGLEAPAPVKQAAARLRRVSVRCVNLGIGRAKLSEKHWIYYPGDTIFHRVFLQGNASPYCNPKGGFGLTCEISYSPTKPLPCSGDALIARCIADCIRVGLFAATDPIWAAHEIDLPYAYVVYDHSRAAAVRTIREWLAEFGIVLAGRYSEWEYYNSDHAFLAGKRAAEEVLAGAVAALDTTAQTA